jgi:hypothetical protein
MEKKITLQQFEKEILAINESKDEKLSETDKVGVLLLASLQEGVDVDKLAEFTKYPQALVRKTVKWLKDSGTYQDGKFCVEWFEKDGGAVALMCDMMCVQGILEKKIEE